MTLHRANKLFSNSIAWLRRKYCTSPLLTIPISSPSYLSAIFLTSFLYKFTCPLIWFFNYCFFAKYFFRNSGILGRKTSNLVFFRFVHGICTKWSYIFFLHVCVNPMCDVAKYSNFKFYKHDAEAGTRTDASIIAWDSCATHHCWVRDYYDYMATLGFYT